jgi:hypothetical protein
MKSTAHLGYYVVYRGDVKEVIAMLEHVVTALKNEAKPDETERSS